MAANFSDFMTTNISMPSTTPTPQATYGLNLGTIVIITLYGIICLAGLIGNGLVIFVVLRYHRLKTVTNIYILNLSTTDSLFLLALPMLIVTAIKGGWVFGKGMCKVYFMLHSINQFTSAFTLTAMAIDRYLATCHPIRSLNYRTPRYALVGVSILWCLSFIVMLPVILYASTMSAPGGWPISCMVLWPATTGIHGHKTFITYTAITAFAIPVTLICTCYIVIIIRLKNGGPRSITNRRHSQFRKATRLVTLIISVFIICWLPYWALQIDMISGDGQGLPPWKFRLYQVFTFLSYANSMLNPLLYAFTNESFRDAFRGAFHCLPEESLVSSRRTSALQVVDSGHLEKHGDVKEQQQLISMVTTENGTTVTKKSNLNDDKGDIIL